MSWDRLDIVGKILSSVVLALIALFIKKGADSIAAAQHEGDLVQNLIADLTSNDERTRQDLALIALNHSVGDRNPPLVIAIAGRLVADYAAGRDSGQALTSVAFGILQQRAPVYAESLKGRVNRSFEDRVTADTAVRNALRSAPDTGNHSVSPLAGDSVAQDAKDLLAPLPSSVVFIQFQGRVSREVIEQLRANFAAAGFAAWPAISQPTRGS